MCVVQFRTLLHALWEPKVMMTGQFTAPPTAGLGHPGVPDPCPHPHYEREMPSDAAIVAMTWHLRLLMEGSTC
jgi:hypothetical protein